MIPFVKKIIEFLYRLVILLCEAFLASRRISHCSAASLIPLVHSALADTTVLIGPLCHFDFPHAHVITTLCYWRVIVVEHKGDYKNNEQKNKLSMYLRQIINNAEQSAGYKSQRCQNAFQNCPHVIKCGNPQSSHTDSQEN